MLGVGRGIVDMNYEYRRVSTGTTRDVVVALARDAVPGTGTRG